MSDNSSAERGIRLSKADVPQHIQRRLQYVKDLEEHFKLGQEKRISQGIYLESDHSWKNQWEQVEGPFLWRCVLASLGNALKCQGCYHPEEDSQQHMVDEVKDLFGPRGTLESGPALERLSRNRSSRGIRLVITDFMQTMAALLDSKVALHGDKGHMVLLRRIEANKMENGEVVIGVRKVDPLAGVVRSQFEPLSQLAKEEGFYRTLSIEKPRIQFPPRK